MNEQFTLTKEQQKTFDLVDNGAFTRNVLIQGKPGVGKSVLINALTSNGQKQYTLAAPTGLAALNIGGKTLHSLFMLPVSKGIIEHDFDKFTTNDNVIKHIRYRLKYLIIDEISMVRSDMFDYINRLLKYIKGNDKPFGGVQMILVGDFYQLPPVVSGFERKQLHDAEFASEFVFDSRAFHEGNFEVVELTEVLRQKDPVFLDLLDQARVGKIQNNYVSVLNKKVGFKDDGRIRLCGGNKTADEVNQLTLRKLEGKAQQYNADCYGDCKELLKGLDEHLQLKIGAQVMVKKNNADIPPGNKSPINSFVVNGTMGRVAALEVDRIEIELPGGRRVFIYRQSMEQKIKDKVDGEWTERIVAYVTQIPVALAWAISMHKSQGQSFDKVHIDASQIFAAGQLYVALSRCRSLDGVSFEAKVNSMKFFANKSVTKFFQKHGATKEN